MPRQPDTRNLRRAASKPSAQLVVAQPKAARSARSIDQPRVEAAIREILFAIGENPDRDGLVETPARVARSYTELFGGLFEKPGRHLGKLFAHEGTPSDIIIVRDIDFTSVCEHHLLPFYGRAQVAYQPGGEKVVGLSKIARTVDEVARRPQIQERLGSQIADLMMEHLGARGVLVILDARHMCMSGRGARQEAASMRTTAVRGEFIEDRALRAEGLGLLLGENIRLG
jgi:GTP cyclohydrolase I